MRISDWSSDVCSSDLGIAVEPDQETPLRIVRDLAPVEREADRARRHRADDPAPLRQFPAKGDRAIRRPPGLNPRQENRKSVVTDKGGSVRGDVGGRRSLKTKKVALSRRRLNKN